MSHTGRKPQFTDENVNYDVEKAYKAHLEKVKNNYRQNKEEINSRRRERYREKKIKATATTSNKYSDIKVYSDTELHNENNKLKDVHQTFSEQVFSENGLFDILCI